MNESIARPKLEPFHDWFLQCWHAGWSEYHSELCHPLDDFRARSVMIQNRAIIRALQSCQSQHGVVPLEFSTRRLFRLGNWAICQFKKLESKDDRLAPQNTQTELSKTFYQQTPLGELGTVPRFTIGYLPNDHYTDYTVHVLLTKSATESNWSYCISTESVPMPTDLFHQPDEQPAQTQKRVKGKQSGPIPDTSADGQAQG